jgi:hypothetical protein
VVPQCLVEVDELFRPGTRGAHPSKVVLLGSLGLDVPGITFLVRPLKGVLKSHQFILPHGGDAFPAIQLPLLGKEVLLQLDGHR